MDISLSKLDQSFRRKPLLVGGKAMEYYDLRESGTDIDLIADEEDVVNLIQKYPNKVKDLYGDLGVCPFEFEIWRTISYYNYDELKEGAIDIGEVLVISKESLLFMKALAIDNEKYLQDVKLIVKALNKENFNKYKKVSNQVSKLIQGIENISYIERKV